MSSLTPLPGTLLISEVYERNFHPRISYVDSVWSAIEFQCAGRGDRARFIGSPRIVAEELHGLIGDVDVILGGPPCQGHSNLNNRSRRNDPRNILYLALPAFAAAVGAKCVIIENVPDIVHDKGLVVQSASRLFESLGYAVTQGVIDGSSLGIPQTRKRHLLIAAQGSLPDVSDTCAAIAAPVRTVRWAIEDLCEVAIDDDFDSPSELSEVNRDRIHHLFETDAYDMPNHKRPPSHRDGHTYPSVYGRLQWDKPAGTITTGFLTPGRGRFIHPALPRTLTPHEAARLQGFPDSFDFRLKDGGRPPKKSLSTMIGDAVPSNISYMAGLAAFAAMDVRS
ncbi:MAG: DNA cytosine methyltransferase [SAR202 cluster bacterium]|nr:DNA (cytosine-5-)-methyltransferase [Chloroflexota bacterium]MQG68176.1 DNA cytosine methyltransferase [SAR202 cluster bacterium]